MYVYIYNIYIYIYIYIGSTSSLIHISLDIMDIFCLHFDFIIFAGNWLMLFSKRIYIPSTFCPTLGHNQGGIYYCIYF